MFTRKVVGWSMRKTLHAEIALEALAMAIRRQRPEPGLLHHSDRAAQYAAEDYRQALAKARIIPSMSRKGNCLDNAPMESFFHTLKVERVHPACSRIAAKVGPVMPDLRRAAAADREITRIYATRTEAGQDQSTDDLHHRTYRLTVNRIEARS